MYALTPGLPPGFHKGLNFRGAVQTPLHEEVLQVSTDTSASLNSEGFLVMHLSQALVAMCPYRLQLDWPEPTW